MNLFVEGSGNAIALAINIIDITKRKVLEAQLFRSQRLEALGQLTGGIVHDFNNPLTPNLGTVELLLKGRLIQVMHANGWN